MSEYFCPKCCGKLTVNGDYLCCPEIDCRSEYSKKDYAGNFDKYKDEACRKLSEELLHMDKQMNSKYSRLIEVQHSIKEGRIEIQGMIIPGKLRYRPGRSVDIVAARELLDKNATLRSRLNEVSAELVAKELKLVDAEKELAELKAKVEELRNNLKLGLYRINKIYEKSVFEAGQEKVLWETLNKVNQLFGGN